MGRMMVRIFLCLSGLCFVYGLNLERECNENILQTYAESNETLKKEFVSFYIRNLHKINPEATYTFPYENSGIYATFNNENRHQINISFQEFSEQQTDRILLTGIKFNKLQDSENTKCNESPNVTNLTISYSHRNTWNDILFESVTGEDNVFAIYKRRSIQPIFIEAITFAFPDEQDATICAQFEVFGCIVDSSLEMLEWSRVRETIFPTPDNSSDYYTGECEAGNCNGGIGLLTDGETGDCYEWTRNGENINTNLRIWFSLNFAEKVQKIILYGSTEASTMQYTVGVKVGGEVTSFINKTIPAATSNNYTSLQLTTQEYFSLTYVSTTFVLIEIVSQEPGVFSLCEVEIFNELGQISPFICKIDETDTIICPEPVITESLETNGNGRITATSTLRTIIPLVDTTVTTPYGTTFNNGRTSIQNTKSSIPFSTTLTTKTNNPFSTTIETKTNSTSPLNGIEVYLFMGVGILAALILSTLICVTIVIVLYIHFLKRKNRPIKSYEFPWGNCEIYGIQNTPVHDPNLFKKVVIDNQVIYVRTSEGMQQYPDMLVNPVYELVDDNVIEFKLCANSPVEATSSLASANLSEVTVIGSNKSPLYEVIT